MRLPIGERVVVEIKKWRHRRTVQQNKYFHALIGEISKLTGMDRDLVKEGLKEAYGNKVPAFGHLVPIPSHLCDISDMQPLINGAEYELAEAGGDPRTILSKMGEL
jgi:hypothetical protein